MKRLFAALLWLLLVPIAQAAEPILRVGQLPSPALAGERLALDVAVLVPGWFTAPLDLPDSLTADGVSVRLAEHASINLNESIGGISYAGLQRRYEVVTQRAGTFTLPAFKLQLTWSDGTLSEVRQLTIPARQFTVVLPAGMEKLGYFIATPRFTLEQRLDRVLTGLRVGDAFTRTVIEQAQDVAAMTLPALQSAGMDGVAIYQEPAELSDRPGERGALDLATRLQRITYVMQAAGHFELPGIELRWFDVSARRVRRASVPALQFDVAPSALATASPRVPASQAAPVMANDPRSVWQRVSTHWVWPWGVAVGVMLLVIFVLRRRLCRFAAALNTPQQSAFRRSLRVLSSQQGSAQQLMAFESWFLSLPRPHAASLQALAAADRTSALAHQLEQFMASVHRRATEDGSPSIRLTRWQACTMLLALRRLHRRSVQGDRPAKNRLPTLQP